MLMLKELRSALFSDVCATIADLISNLVHEHDFSRACEGFGLPYSLATTRDAFEAAFEEARRAGGPHCIEVSADKEEGHDIIAELRSAARPVAARVAVALQQSEVSVSLSR